MLSFGRLSLFQRINKNANLFLDGLDIKIVSLFDQRSVIERVDCMKKHRSIYMKSSHRAFRLTITISESLYEVKHFDR
jgi:hypothetical protein